MFTRKVKVGSDLGQGKERVKRTSKKNWLVAPPTAPSRDKPVTKTKDQAPETRPLGGLRRRAEALLRKSPRAVSQASVTDAQRLVHELGVHQAELEMQNEELRRVQLELENSRDRLARLYDFAPIGYLTLDAEGVICEANATAARLLGLERRALLQKRLSRFVAAESQEDLYVHRQRVFTTTGLHSCELKMRPNDRAAFIGQLECVVEPTEQNQPAQCLMALSDVTERRQAELARARLAAIVDSSDDAIIARNLNDIITVWNEGAEKLFGYSAAEIVGRPFAALVPPDHRDELLRVRQRTERGERATLPDTVRVAKDGRHISVSCGSSPIRDASGRIVGTSVILRDTSRQKAAETAIRRSEQALADFFAEAPIGLLWVAPDGRILRANRAQAAMLGCRDEDLLGSRWPEFCADPEAAADMLERLARRESVRDHLLRLLGKDRSLVHVFIDANGSWEDGKLVHSRWFVRDVTRRVELEKEILLVGERVQRRIGQDLHDDLCQQLTGIEFLGRALERRLTLNSPAEAARARELSHLTRQAITHARELAHGMSPVELETGGLAEALGNLAARVTNLFHIDCRFRCDGQGSVDDPVARIYLYRIAQESVSNAIKHGKAGRVQIGLAMNKNNIVLSVQDNGGGLPPKLPNYGFGLRIMEYRAGILGGSLAVRRRKPGGTLVVCSIPRFPSRTAAEQKR
jgi:PAS domain S-box-containing protein